jgi:hypothetical protein
MMLRLLLVLLSLLVPTACLAGDGGPPRDRSSTGLRIGILFDNMPAAPGFETAWGFAAVIEGLEQTILFDTGGDGGLLLRNMARMGVDPDQIDAVFLSHSHGDHVRGLPRFLQRNPRVRVFMPASFPSDVQEAARRYGATVVPIAAARRLYEAAYSSGPMGQLPEEQALIIDTEQGLVIVTGCAHPGIVDIVRGAMRRHDKEGPSPPGRVSSPAALRSSRPRHDRCTESARRDAGGAESLHGQSRESAVSRRLGRGLPGRWLRRRHRDRPVMSAQHIVLRNQRPIDT